jgi:hippurate hydrolase
MTFTVIPETAFEEVRTADIVADKLKEFGLEVHRGLAKTGVVGVLRSGSSRRAIGLRADMDALDVHETNDFDHKSTIPGKMHACGHDGPHGDAAGRRQVPGRDQELRRHRLLSSSSRPRRTRAAAAVMVEEGLFEKFPVDGVYGMHNIPGIPVGSSPCAPAR